MRRIGRILSGWITACWTECAWIIPMVCAIRNSISTGCGRGPPEAWIIGEKILEPGEYLRAELAD